MGKDDKRNAKDEFLQYTKDCKVISSIITFADTEWFNISYQEHVPNEELCIILPPLYSQDEYELFLERLNRTYDSGYGGQELFGVIFCENGIWFERGEYDGSEWWNRHQYPDMRNFFKNDLVLKYERSMKLKQLDD